jgi:MFS transporter, PAT family, beta-lactamase induction signal transducer AmpG
MTAAKPERASPAAEPMPPAAPAAPRAQRFRDALAVYLKARVLIVMFLGFASGLPLALSGSTLQVWATESGVDLKTVGLFTVIGTPYTIKFLWAPVIDALDVPVLARWLGRRRGWLIASQLVLMLAIILLGLCDPVAAPEIVIVGALFVATAAATQDIVIDAFRVESLAADEQAAGMASYVAAYRIGMLASTAGALFLVTGFEDAGFARASAWTFGYAAMAGLVLIGMITTLIATEPEKSALAASEHAARQGDNPLARVSAAALASFKDFFTRDLAVVTLVFVVLYKFTDALAGAMTAPFVIDQGFSRNEYAAIVKGVGLAATLAGGFAGGFVARAWSLPAALAIGGVLQATSNLAFTVQALVGRDIAMLTVTITVENFTGAIGTVIFVAYLSALCRNPLHTATQYALLTALAAVGRTYLSATSGVIAVSAGWPWFFAICALAGVPSLMLLAWLHRRGHFTGLGTPVS